MSVAELLGTLLKKKGEHLQNRPNPLITGDDRGPEAAGDEGCAVAKEETPRAKRVRTLVGDTCPLGKEEKGDET